MITALTRLWTAVSQVSPSLRKIEWITFSTDRSVSDRASAIPALFFPSAISRSTSRSRGVSSPSGELSSRAFSGDQRLDDLRVDHRAALRDGADRADELVEVVDALLQEVRPSGAASLQERERVARGGVLAEDDDADLRVRHAQPLGGLDPLVGLARRHADVSHDDVGLLALDGGEQRVEVVAGRRDLDLGARLEQAPQALAGEVVVLGEHEPDRHAQRIRP